LEKDDGFTRFVAFVLMPLVCGVSRRDNKEGDVEAAFDATCDETLGGILAGRLGNVTVVAGL